MAKRLISSLFFSVMIFCSLTVSAQNQITINLPKLFSDGKLTVLNRNAKLLSDSSRNYIFLNEDYKEGLVWINGVSFSTGTIEIDLKGRDVYQHSFVGIAFHGINDSTFDAIYFRPFQFRTDDPVRRVRGIQYVSHPVLTWQFLRKESPGQFEKEVKPVPDPNNWFHASIRITESEVSVFVDYATEPCLKVSLLGKNKSGMIGLFAADRSDGSFSNLSIQTE